MAQARQIDNEETAGALQRYVMHTRNELWLLTFECALFFVL